MGFRFRKSIRLAPGVRLNLSKRGASVSLGGRGLTTNVSTRGTRTTVGLPGTGLSYSHFTPAASSARRGSSRGGASAGLPVRSNSSATPSAPSSVRLWVWGIIAVVAAFAILPAAALWGLLAAGALVAWGVRRQHAQASVNPSSLTARWALVKQNPQDPQYAVLLAEWYAPGITEAERQANGVP